MSIIEDILNTIPVNIERLIKDTGIKLNKNAKEGEIAPGINRSSTGEILGEIKKIGDEYHILVLGSDHYYRKRFTMAHELGHFILHKEKIDKFKSIVDSKKIISDIDDYNEEAHNHSLSKEDEIEANNYAAEILMPEEDIRKNFDEFEKNLSDEKFKEEEEKIRRIVTDMSKMFQVSRAAMNIRLHNLDLVNNIFEYKNNN